MRTFLYFFFILLIASCSHQTNRGVKCPTGKAKKPKTYKIKKWKSYERGYRVAGNGNNASRPSVNKPPVDTVNQVQAEKIDAISEQLEIEKDSVVFTAEQKEIPQPTVDEQNAKKKDTIRRRSYERWSREPTVYEPEEQKEKPDTTYITSTTRISTPDHKKRDTVRRRTVIRHTDIDELDTKETDPLSTDVGGKPKIDFDPVTQLVFKNKVYEKDEDFEFNEVIEFVPNFDIFMYPDKVKEQVDSLVDFLKEHPEKKIYIYGNGGRDDADLLSEFEIKNRWLASSDGFSGRYVKNYYGSSREVYEQVFTGLGNYDSYEIMRIKQEGRRLLRDSDRTVLGSLLHGRAKNLKSLLIQMGIDRKRITAKRGEFVPYPNPTVKVKIYND